MVVAAVDLVSDLVGYKDNLEIGYFVALDRQPKGYKNNRFDSVVPATVPIIPVAC